MDGKVMKYFENPRKIKAVKPIENYTLLLTFDNGEFKQYSMIDELNGVFTILRDKEKFNQVFINEVGNIAWNIDNNIDSSKHWENQIDLCKDMLYMESKTVLAWDPDFTKVTPAERTELEEIEKDMKENDTVPHDAINWD